MHDRDRGVSEEAAFETSPEGLRLLACIKALRLVWGWPVSGTARISVTRIEWGLVD